MIMTKRKITASTLRKSSMSSFLKQWMVGIHVSLGVVKFCFIFEDRSWSTCFYE